MTMMYALSSILIRESLLVIPVFLVVWLLTRFSPARKPLLQYGLWSLVLLRLVLPPDLSFTFSLSSLLALDPLPSDSLAWLHPIEPQGTLVQAGLQVVEAQPTSTWPMILLSSAWLLGVLCLGLTHLKQRLKWICVLKQAQECNADNLNEILNRWRSNLGVRRKVRLVIGTSGYAPFTLGWLRPVIYLPEQIATLDSHYHLEAVIAHEMAHIRRFDDLFLRFQGFIGIVYFFHPLVWICARRLNQQRELACDQLVLSFGHLDSARYGRSLLATLGLGLNEPTMLATLGHASTNLKQRIRAIARPNRHRVPGWQATTLVLVTALLLLPLASANPLVLNSPRAGQQPTAPTETNQVWLNPLSEARISSPFGLRRYKGQKRHHRGIDLAAPIGTPINAPADGTVTTSLPDYATNPKHGTVLVINHPNGYSSFYSHLSEVLVRPGSRVSRGQPIALVGVTGQTTGPHLHLEVWRDGQALDPDEVLPELKVKP